MLSLLPSRMRRRVSSALGLWLGLVALLAHGQIAAPMAKAQLLAGDICYAAGKDGAPAQGAGHDHCALCASTDVAPPASVARAGTAEERDSRQFDDASVVARRVDAASQRAPPA